MKSHTTSGFRKRFAALPADVRNHARVAYRLFLSNPHHPSLHFKRVHETEPVYSARVGRSYRVVGLIEDDNVVVWFWIGPQQWKALTVPSAGTSGTERIHTIMLAPNQYFISWVESNGTTVSNVIDLTNRRVAAFVTFQTEAGRQAMTDEGSIHEIAAQPDR